MTSSPSPTFARGLIVRRNKSGFLVSNKSMKMMLITANLYLILLSVTVCVGQEVRSSAANYSQKQSEAFGFKCPDRELNQPRPTVKFHLGDVTKKAIELPQPEYWRWAKGSRISGKAQAEVVIDINSGRVVWARLLNGHSLLQVAVNHVVCRARFAPINDVNVRASGIITYWAGHRR
jgi:hypothetical protein